MPNKHPAIEQTRYWVEHVVIKHNFCPFAHKPARHQRIRYTASQADTEEQLINDLIDELILLQNADHEKIETSLLIVPNCLNSFLLYNRFLDVIDALIKQFNLEGVIQVASFHPEYQFADLDADDVRNYTNRSPYPMFHLILESSIEKARLNYPNVELIPEHNMAQLLKLGLSAAKLQLEKCYQTTSNEKQTK